MKAAQITSYGGSEVVEIKDNVALPLLSVGRVIIEARVAGVNPVDWKIREGYLQKMAPLQFPATLGGDFSGVIIKVGENVSGFNEGDEVYGTALALGSGSGSFAEFIAADVKFIAKKPEKTSHVEAAALPLAGVSALQALTEHIGLKKGQKILIHGGAGGIGSLAIQIAKHLGAYVATTVSERDKEFVKKLGANEVIDYKNQYFSKMLKDYDAVFDTVGGETYRNSFSVLKKGGVVVSMIEEPRAELMEKYGVKAISQSTSVNNEMLSKLAKLVDEGSVKVHIDKIFTLEQSGEALAYMQNGHPLGKVVVRIK